MKNIKVKIIGGGYCECGCKGECDTREVQITKGKKVKTLSIYNYVDDLLDEISKKKYFEFEIIKK